MNAEIIIPRRFLTQRNWFSRVITALTHHSDIVSDIHLEVCIYMYIYNIYMASYAKLQYIYIFWHSIFLVYALTFYLTSFLAFYLASFQGFILAFFGSRRTPLQPRHLKLENQPSLAPHAAGSRERLSTARPSKLRREGVDTTCFHGVNTKNDETLEVHGLILGPD